MSKWISVEDKLPREFIDTVLVSRNKGNKSVMAAFYNGEDFISLSIAGNHAYKEPTHWMPLPEPPKDLD